MENALNKERHFNQWNKNPDPTFSVFSLNDEDLTAITMYNSQMKSVQNQHLSDSNNHPLRCGRNFRLASHEIRRAETMQLRSEFLRMRTPSFDEVAPLGR